jgi:hypothetical protein
LQRLLLDRTLGLLAHMPVILPDDLPNSEFVAVLPQLVGSEVRAFVMLTYSEFLQMFSGPSGQLQ